MAYRSQKLFQRMRTELDIDVPNDAYVFRTRAGRWQKSRGAWTSVIGSHSDSMFEIGLYRPISELLKCPNLEKFDSYGLCVDCNCKGKCEGLE